MRRLEWAQIYQIMGCTAIIEYEETYISGESKNISDVVSLIENTSDIRLVELDIAERKEIITRKILAEEGQDIE